MSKLRSGQRFSIDIWDTNKKNVNIPKYTLHICDSTNKKLLEKVFDALFMFHLK
jgi:hypothetical protein